MKLPIVFPKRFEMEGTDPMQCPVVVVTEIEVAIFKNVAEFLELNQEILPSLVGPMADMYEGQRAVRFESREVYERLST